MAVANEVSRLVGARVRALRTRQKMSQGALARLMGRSQGAMSDLESGKTAWTVEALYGAAEALGVTAVGLMPERSEMGTAPIVSAA